MTPAEHRALYALWLSKGGDKALFGALLPVIQRRLKPPPSEFRRRGTCTDCEINAGPGWMTEGLNRQGRCPACQRHFERFGPSPRVSRDDAEAS